MSLTPDDVHNVSFHRAPFGKRGYAEDQVDLFLDLVARTLGGTGTLTADDVHDIAFGKPPFGKRGYAEDEVDAFLDLIERELRTR